MWVEIVWMDLVSPQKRKDFYFNLSSYTFQVRNRYRNYVCFYDSFHALYQIDAYFIRISDVTPTRLYLDGGDFNTVIIVSNQLNYVFLTLNMLLHITLKKNGAFVWSCSVKIFLKEQEALWFFLPALGVLTEINLMKDVFE